MQYVDSSTKWTRAFTAEWKEDASDDGSVGDKDDGATSITSFAAILLAAVSSLMF